MTPIAPLQRTLIDPTEGLAVTKEVDGVVYTATVEAIVNGVPILVYPSGRVEAVPDWRIQGWQLADPYPTFPERWVAIWSGSAPKLYASADAANNAVDVDGHHADYILHLWSDPIRGPQGAFDIPEPPFQS